MTQPVVSTDRVLIQASLSQLHLVTVFSFSLAAKGKLSSRDTYRLRLALDELVSNIIMHGYKGASGEISLTGAASDGEVRVQVEDRAPRFDPKAAVRPSVPLETRASEFGGFGLFLIFQAVDEFDYEFTDDVNRSILVVRQGKA